MFIDAEYWNGEEYLPCRLNADHIERARLCEDGTYEAVSVSGRAYRITDKAIQKAKIDCFVDAGLFNLI